MTLFLAINSSLDEGPINYLSNFKSESEYYAARKSLKRELEKFLILRNEQQDQEILQFLLLAKEYMNRSLWKLANKATSKGKSLAYELEAWDELAMLLKAEEVIPEKSDSDSYKKEVFEVQQEKEKIDTIGSLILKVKYSLNEILDPDKRNLQLDQLFRDSRIIEQNPPVSSNGQYRLFTLLRRLNTFNEDHKTAIGYSLKSIDLIERKIETGDRKFLDRLLREFSDLAHLYNEMGDEENYQKTLARIKFFPIDFPGLEIQKYLKYNLPMVIYGLDHGKLRVVEKDTDDLFSFLSQNDGKLPPKDSLICFFFLAKFYFWNGQVKKMVKCLRELHLLKKKSETHYNVLYPYILCIEICSLVHREEFDLVQSRINALKRHLRKGKKSGKFFEEFIASFSTWLKIPYLERTKRLEKSKNNFLDLFARSNGKGHFDFFDPIPFYESMIRKIPAAIALQEWKRSSNERTARTG